LGAKIRKTLLGVDVLTSFFLRDIKKKIKILCFSSPMPAVWRFWGGAQ